ncbi:hypothetical protein ABBQ32_004860 [Trebouxia sp. C0010 RCD-2024]
MLRSLILASTQAPVKHATHSRIQIGQAPAPRAEPMSTLPEPPRHLLSELGRRAKGDAHQSSGAAKAAGAQHHMPDLQPFACGLTGTSVEVLEPRQCDIEGTVPSWLQGDLYRNGPGTFDVDTSSGSVYSIAHWFGGLTVMHKFQISGGKVIYRNRHLNREAEHYIEAENQEPGVMLWHDPCGTLLGRAFSLFKQAALKGPSSFETFTDPKTGKQGNGNIGVTVGRFRDNQLVSRTDANVLIALDPVDLTVTRKFNYTSILPEAKGVTSASHVERDEQAGLTYDFTMDLNYKLNGMYNVFCIPDDANEDPYMLARIQDTPCYIHSFAQTEQYLILMVWPCVFDPLRMVLNKSVFHDLQWKPKLGVKLHVIDKRKGGRGHMTTYRHPAFYCFHQLNAFESGDDLIVDLAAYPDHSIMVQLHRTNMLFGLNPMDAAIPTRIKLPDLPAATAAGLGRITDASSHVLSAKPIGFELFTINPGQKCKPYRYSWGVSCQPGDAFFNCIVRLDIKSGEHQVWAEENTYPGEPIFVPRPGATEEDDGVLLSVVLAGAQKRSFLLILDASDLTEVARAWTRDPVALGFHGHFGTLDEFQHVSKI